MIEFRDGFYADVRTEDRSRTVISYQARYFGGNEKPGGAPRLPAGL